MSGNGFGVPGEIAPGSQHPPHTLLLSFHSIAFAKMLRLLQDR